jgi:hypothetical protein
MWRTRRQCKTKRNEDKVNSRFRSAWVHHVVWKCVVPSPAHSPTLQLKNIETKAASQISRTRME